MKPARIRPAETARSVDEWIGATPDAAIPNRVRLRVFERFGGVCQITGRKIRPGEPWDLDHRKRLRDGGEHRELNLWPVLTIAHRAKTADENRQAAKADRMRAKHLGLKRSSRPITGWKRMDGSPVSAKEGK